MVSYDSSTKRPNNCSECGLIETAFKLITKRTFNPKDLNIEINIAISSYLVLASHLENRSINDKTFISHNGCDNRFLKII